MPPKHYNGRIETVIKIEEVIDGLPAKEAAQLYNVLKYFDRAGKKKGESAKKDLKKANNSAHRLVYGHWRKNK